MRYREFVRLMVLVLGSTAVTYSQGHSTSRPAQVVIFERRVALGTVEIAKLQQSLSIAQTELQAPAGPLPDLFVFHINDVETELFGVKETSVWRTGRDGGVRYEWWIVGEPTDQTYSALAEIFLERYHGLAVDDAERGRVLHAITQRLSRTVSVAELRQNKPTEVKSSGPAAPP